MQQLSSKNTKLFRHLKKWLEKAILDFALIQEGDRLLIGISGGADSFALLDLLDSSMVFTPDFSLLAVHLDMGFDTTHRTCFQIEQYLQEHGYEHVVEKTDIGVLAHSDFNKKNPCFLCSQRRRKRIFEIADEKGCNKIVLAHHRDDIIETLLINMFYGREVSTMMPRQSLFGGKLQIIRPLAYLREDLIKKYSRERQLPVIKNACPSSEHSKRNYIKKLLNELERENPQIRHNIFTALSHIKPDYLPSFSKNK